MVDDRIGSGASLSRFSERGSMRIRKFLVDLTLFQRPSLHEVRAGRTDERSRSPEKWSCM